MRTPVTVKIKFKSASLDHFIERYAVDVSKGGIFVRTPKPLAVGTTLNFEFQLQDGTPLLAGSGTVVWVRDEAQKPGVSPGMGVRFDELPDNSQKVLDKVLAHKDQAQQFGEPAASDDAPGEIPPMPAEADDAPPPPPSRAPEVSAVAPETAPPALDMDLPEITGKASEDLPPLAEQDKPDAGKLDGGKAEGARTENLGRILFADDEGEEPPPAPKPAEDVAAITEPKPKVDKPKADKPKVDKPKVDKPKAKEPPAAAARTTRPAPEEEEPRSSPIVWLIILLMLGGAGYVWWKYFGPGKEVAAPPPVAADIGVAAPAPDTRPEPPPKPKLTLKVESTPEGAKILVDGKDIGMMTPADVPDLAPETEVEITLDLAGKKLHRGKVTPTADQPYKVELKEAAVRKIRITSEPVGAKIYLNGRKIGVTPMDLKKALKEKRSYKVKLKLEGYKSLETKFVPGSLTYIRDADDEVGIVASTLEAKAPAASRRKRPRPRKPADEAPETTPAPAAPRVTPPAKLPGQPLKATPKVPPTKVVPTPAPAPAKKAPIKKPAWSE